MRRALLSLVILFSCYSCGDSEDQQKANLILSSNIAMGSGDCDKAIQLMTSITLPDADAEFIRTLALAYACKANFNVTTFIGTDLAKFGSDGTFNGTALFSTSDDATSIDDDDFTYLQNAMDTLLYAGGLSKDADPTSSLRSEIFTDDELNELEMVLVYLQLVALGRFFHYHGDANTSGEKTGCIIQYENVSLDVGGDLNTLLLGGADLGSCIQSNFTSAGVGSGDLGAPGSFNVSRMCKGVTLLNNFFHVFPSLLARISGGDFDNVEAMESVMTAINSAMTTAKTGTSNTVAGVLSQTRCESLNASDDDFLQVFYFFFMEQLFK